MFNRSAKFFLISILMVGVLLSGRARAEMGGVSGGEVPWPWALTDLWSNIEGVWISEKADLPYAFRFTIVNKNGDNPQVKVEKINNLATMHVVSRNLGWGRDDLHIFYAILSSENGPQKMAVQAYVTDRRKKNSEVVLRLSLRLADTDSGIGGERYYILRKFSEIRH